MAMLEIKACKTTAAHHWNWNGDDFQEDRSIYCPFVGVF
jgi:hypothetical protein